MSVGTILRHWTERVCRLRRTIERELKLIAAFAPLPSDVQYEIDLESWPTSCTNEAAEREPTDVCETARRASLS